MSYIPPKRIFSEEEVSLIDELFYNGVKISEIRKQLKCGKQVLDRFLIDNGYSREYVNGMQKTEEQFLKDLETINPNIIVLSKYTDCKTKVLVKCKIDGYEWEVTPDNLLQGKGCPVCGHKVTAPGINDMWTTDPDLAKLLADPNDGYRYSSGTNKKLKWKCLNCGEIVESDPRVIIRSGLRIHCPVCSDTIKFPEKFAYLLLTQLGIEFEFQYSPDWIKPKRYDFYLPKFNIIIETNGKQHYEEVGFSNLGGRTLEEEQENDAFKLATALQNGIDDVVFVDCSYSTVDFIKNSFKNNQKINNLLQINNTDWDKLESDLYKPFALRICELWDNNEELRNVEKLSKYAKLSPVTIRKYLNIGAKHGFCTFDADKYRRSKTAKKVYELDLNMNIIKLWDSIPDIIEYYGYSKTCCIHRYIMGYRNGSHKYKGRLWYREDEFNNILND